MDWGIRNNSSDSALRPWPRALAHRHYDYPGEVKYQIEGELKDQRSTSNIEIQVFSRVAVLWLVLHPVKEVR